MLSQKHRTKLTFPTLNAVGLACRVEQASFKKTLSSRLYEQHAGNVRYHDIHQCFQTEDDVLKTQAPMQRSWTSTVDKALPEENHSGTFLFVENSET